MNPNMHAYFIEYATRDTTAQEVKEAFDREFGGSFVERVDESVTQDYADYWKSFTIYFKESCVDDLFGKNMAFHDLFDRHVLYYNSNAYWDVHMIKLCR